MEGLFKSEAGAPVILIGQPDPEHGTIENPLAVNDMLSYLIYGTVRAEAKGLDAFPRADWPDNIPLLFFAYHIIAGNRILVCAFVPIAAPPRLRGRLFPFVPAVLWRLL